MLTKKQIKIMAKPYTNKRIISMGTNMVTCNKNRWWGNGYIIFFEDSPAMKEYPKNWDTEDCVDATEDMKDTVDNLIATAEMAVYPVEIRLDHSDEYSRFKPLTMLRFTDGRELNLWANARYVTTIQKRYKRELTWTAAGSSVLVAHADKPIAVLMCMCPDVWDEVPDWYLKNEYIEEVERCLSLM